MSQNKKHPIGCFFAREVILGSGFGWWFDGTTVGPFKLRAIDIEDVGSLFIADDCLIDNHTANAIMAWNLEHNINEALFDDGAQTTRTSSATHRQISRRR